MNTSQNITPQRVLLIDDEREIRHMSRTILEITFPGIVVDEVVDGEEFVQMVNKTYKSGKPYNLHITDMLMPRKSGLEALLELRAQGDETPTIIYTGTPYEVSEYLEQIKQNMPSKTMILAKPFDIKKLVAVINYVLNNCVDPTPTTVS